MIFGAGGKAADFPNWYVWPTPLYVGGGSCNTLHRWTRRNRSSQSCKTIVPTDISSLVSYRATQSTQQLTYQQRADKQKKSVNRTNTQAHKQSEIQPLTNCPVYRTQVHPSVPHFHRRMAVEGLNRANRSSMGPSELRSLTRFTSWW